MVGNGEYLGGIPSFIPNVKCDDGTLDIFVVKSTGIQAFKDYIGKKLFEDSNENDIFHVKAKSIHIETEEEKSRYRWRKFTSHLVKLNCCKDTLR